MSRFSLFVQNENQLFVVRVAGSMDGWEFVERLFAEYDQLGNPWAFNRIMDFRRYEDELSRVHLEEMNRRWVARLPATPPITRVAIVRQSVSDYEKKPAFTPKIPSRVVCQFTNFHEAVAWALTTGVSQPLALEGNWQIVNVNAGLRMTICDQEVFLD